MAVAGAPPPAAAASSDTHSGGRREAIGAPHAYTSSPFSLLTAINCHGIDRPSGHARQHRACICPHLLLLPQDQLVH